jgi:hypothetical protein
MMKRADSVCLFVFILFSLSSYPIPIFSVNRRTGARAVPKSPRQKEEGIGKSSGNP